MPLGHRNLIWQFARREVLGRYRGSVLGVGWSVLTPMAMLAVYTLVFRHIFKAKWPGVEDGNMSFALNLFAGLLVFNWAAEFFSRAPRLMTDQPNLVTKVVFPLQVLPWSALLSSFFHALVSCAVWLAGCLLFGQGLHMSWLALPLVFLALMPDIIRLRVTLSTTSTTAGCLPGKDQAAAYWNGSSGSRLSAQSAGYIKRATCAMTSTTTEFPNCL